ncbi:MAG: FKBP-type peptidyl-prolyl cis-trans isomerase [Treponema sp.]|nr:FKBP-type peptidyl-prolyl cis-trans isomerase [Treponema sp.]
MRNGAGARNFQTNQAAFNSLLSKARERTEAQARAQREKDLAEIDARYPNLIAGPNGVRYLIQKEGTGPKPSRGGSVRVNYKGMFLSGEVFDASEPRGEPLEFRAGAGEVIPGWDLTVLDMKTGEKRLVVIPPELAYGERGAGGVIPPNAFLVFEMELAGIR